MNDTASFFVIAAGLSVVGGVIGYLIHRYRNKPDKKMQEVMNNPALLIQELKKHGKIYDIGKDDEKEELEFVYEINPETGNREVQVKRHPVKVSKARADQPDTKPEKKKGSKKPKQAKLTKGKQ